MMSSGRQASAEGDHHALAHAAGELVRVLAGARRADADVAEELRDALLDARPRRPRARAAGSPRRSGRTRACTGSSAFNAPWKTIDTVRQRRSRMPRSVRRWMCMMPGASRAQVDLARVRYDVRAAAGRAAPARSSSCRSRTRRPGRAPRRAAAGTRRRRRCADLAPRRSRGRRPSGRARRAAVALGARAPRRRRARPALTGASAASG